MAPSDLNVHVSIQSFPLFIISSLSLQSAASPLSAPRPSSSTQSMWLILRGRYRTNSCRINWMESLAPRQQRDVQTFSLSPCLMFPSANIGMIFKGRGGTSTWKMSWNRSPWESMPLAAEWAGVGGGATPPLRATRVNTEWIWKHLAANGRPGTCQGPTPSLTINPRLIILALCVGWGRKLVWWEDHGCFDAFFILRIFAFTAGMRRQRLAFNS